MHYYCLDSCKSCYSKSIVALANRGTDRVLLYSFHFHVYPFYDFEDYYLLCLSRYLLVFILVNLQMSIPLCQPI